jgi:type IV secretion system protein TrbL
MIRTHLLTLVLRKSSPIIRKLLYTTVLTGAFLVASTRLSFAQSFSFPVTSPSAITNQYKQAQNLWFNNIGAYARRLFFLLAAIEVAWSLTLLVLEKSDFHALAATLVRKIMWIGTFYAFLINAGVWIPAIINSFRAVGEIGANVGPVSPSVVLGTGLQLSTDLFDGASNAGFLSNPGPAFTLVFAALITFLAYVGITIQYVVACVESYLVVGAGVIFLGFGGSRWTMPYVERYVGLAISVGIKLMTLILLVGLGLQLATAPDSGWVVEAEQIGKSADPAMTSFDVMAASLIFLAVCWMAPKLVSGLIGGSPAFTAGDILSPSMTLAASSLTGASWALAGGGATVTAGRAARAWLGDRVPNRMTSGESGSRDRLSEVAPVPLRGNGPEQFACDTSATPRQPSPPRSCSARATTPIGQVHPPDYMHNVGEKAGRALRNLRRDLKKLQLPNDSHHHGHPPSFGGSSDREE